jgi:hypothetical protein
MIFIMALVFALLQGGSAATRIQAGTTVRPETTTVGQHFVATVRVRAPRGAIVRFPARPDSSAQVDSAGAATRTDTTIDAFTESSVTYVLAAWDTGTQSLGLDSLTVSSAGEERTVALPGFKVYVRSVLPADTALRKPKPFRPALAVPATDWLAWILAAAAAALAVTLFFVWRRWRRRVARGLTPLQLAQREFARVESQRLVESGEYDRFAVEMVAVMRAYLAAVVPLASRSATTHELAVALRHATVVPVQRMIALLDAADLIKFARERPTAERAIEIGAEARRIVAETDSAVEAAKVAAAESKSATVRKAA